mgnify:CR=1 FL=1
MIPPLRTAAATVDSGTAQWTDYNGVTNQPSMVVHQGVKLFGVTGNEAVVEIGGERVTLRLGRAVERVDAGMLRLRPRTKGMMQKEHR